MADGCLTIGNLRFGHFYDQVRINLTPPPVVSDRYHYILDSLLCANTGGVAQDHRVSNNLSERVPRATVSSRYPAISYRSRKLNCVDENRRMAGGADHQQFWHGGSSRF